MNDEKLRCPDMGGLALLAERPDDALQAEMAAHVFVCEDCWRAFEDVLYPQDEQMLAPDDASIVQRFVQSHFAGGNPFEKLKQWVNEHPVFDYAAVDLRWRTAAGLCAGDDGRPREPLELVFVSSQTEDGGHAWRVTLKLEAVGDPNGTFSISVEDRGHAPVAACELTVCNQRVPIKDGKGELSYQSFVAGLRDSRVKVKFPDGKETSGELALF